MEDAILLPHDLEPPSSRAAVRRQELSRINIMQFVQRNIAYRTQKACQTAVGLSRPSSHWPAKRGWPGLRPAMTNRQESRRHGRLNVEHNRWRPTHPQFGYIAAIVPLP